MASEAGIIDEFVYETLTANSTLSGLMSGIASRVVDTLAPQGTTAPYIVYQLQTPFDVNGVGSIRIMVDDEYLIRVIDKTSSFRGTLKSIADEIDRTLHTINGTASGGTVMSVTREREFKLVEIDDSGTEYRHLGAFWRFFAQS